MNFILPFWPDKKSFEVKVTSYALIGTKHKLQAPSVLASAEEEESRPLYGCRIKFGRACAVTFLFFYLEVSAAWNVFGL